MTIFTTITKITSPAVLFIYTAPSLHALEYEEHWHAWVCTLKAILISVRGKLNQMLLDDFDDSSQEKLSEELCKSRSTLSSYVLYIMGILTCLFQNDL
jgi:hypothetical protein